MSTKDQPSEWFELSNDIDGYPAIMRNGAGPRHIVDARTFDGSGESADPDVEMHNVGWADTYCGLEYFGRMLGFGDEDKYIESRFCGNCLRALEFDTGGVSDE